MKVTRKSDKAVIATIATNRSLTIDEAMRLVGYPWIEDGDNSGYLVDGIYYSADDLQIEE